MTTKPKPPVSYRFIIHPGWIRSKNDGDIHWISGAMLMRLYRVFSHESVIVDEKNFPGSEASYRERPGDIHLYPNYYGNYYIHEAILESWDGK